jgi:RNA-directed DNA polymerase
VLEPIYEKDFAEHSYGFRPGRGCKDALRTVLALIESGHQFVVDADLRSYFDSIPHEALLAQVEEKVSDGRVLALLKAYLKADVMEGMKRWEPDSGSPQGAVISPLLSNIYLDPLDQLATAEGLKLIRYADDFVILCRSADDAETALQLVQHWVAEAGLSLHPEKTKVVDVTQESFEFLGYRIGPDGRWPRDKSLRKLKDSIRVLTRRNNGHSLEDIIKRTNSVLRGWFAYFKHCRWYIFERLDRWIRRRLRSILRGRSKGRGISRGNDHVRWPNAFFTDRGLFSLMAAYESVSQSA